MRPLLTALCLLLLATACENNSSQSVEEKAPCAELDSLIGSINKLQSDLDAPRQQDIRTQNLVQSVIVQLEANQSGPKECNYLNEAVHSDHLRFEFVDGLTHWTIRDTFSEGIRQLIELRSVFSDDSAISEFFSEEIARVALENPLCYHRYFQAHPGQRQFLLNSTKWSRSQLPRLIEGFETIAPGGEISAFLTGLLSQH